MKLCLNCNAVMPEKHFKEEPTHVGKIVGAVTRLKLAEQKEEQQVLQQAELEDLREKVSDLMTDNDVLERRLERSEQHIPLVSSVVGIDDSEGVTFPITLSTSTIYVLLIVIGIAILILVIAHYHTPNNHQTSLNGNKAQVSNRAQSSNYTQYTYPLDNMGYEHNTSGF